MWRLLGNFGNVFSLVLCAVLLGAWKTQPYWLAAGWAQQSELEVHVADGYMEVVLAHGLTLDRFEALNAGQWFAHGRRSSGWGSPLMNHWDSSSAHIEPMGWFGQGRQENPANPSAPGASTPSTPSAQWFAIDSWLVCLLCMIWPACWVMVRVRHQHQEEQRRARQLGDGGQSK